MRLPTFCRHFLSRVQVNKLILTWDVATSGMYNGYVDSAEVKYQVRKMPSGEIVDNAATSPYTYNVTQEKAEKCFFDVTPTSTTTTKAFQQHRIR